MMTSTCPDSTCLFRNRFGFCTQTVCILPEKREKDTVFIGCELCKYDLDDGDYLYQSSSQDYAIVYEQIIAHYCPCCGRKLTKR